METNGGAASGERAVNSVAQQRLRLRGDARYSDVSVEGNLVRQGSAEQVFSGEKNNSIGPGHYEVDRDLSKNAKGVTWHASNKSRELYNDNKRAKEQSNLGPGAYNVEKQTTSFSRYRRSKKVECSPLGGRMAEYVQGLNTAAQLSNESETESEEEVTL